MFEDDLFKNHHPLCKKQTLAEKNCDDKALNLVKDSLEKVNAQSLLNSGHDTSEMIKGHSIFANSIPFQKL